jgi:hypothetical protein
VEAEEGKLIAAVKYRGDWVFLLGTIGELILDYRKYDPDFNPREYPSIYRGDMLTVNESNAEGFLAVMNEYRLSIEQLLRYKNEYPEDPVVDVLIDFDEKFYCNGYAELPLEKYVPKGWKSEVGEPQKHLPVEVRRLIE